MRGIAGRVSGHPLKSIRKVRDSGMDYPVVSDEPTRRSEEGRAGPAKNRAREAARHLASLMLVGCVEVP